MIQILIVSKNDAMVSNVKTWKKSSIENGEILVDHAATKEEADRYCQTTKYDLIFQNGMHIIDTIEKYQADAKFAYIGPKNQVYKNTVDPYSQEDFNRLLNSASNSANTPLKPWAIIGGWAKPAAWFVTVVIIPLMILLSSLHFNTKSNTEQIKQLNLSMKKIEETTNEIKTSVATYEAYYKAYMDRRKEKE